VIHLTFHIHTDMTHLGAIHHADGQLTPQRGIIENASASYLISQVEVFIPEEKSAPLLLEIGHMASAKGICAKIGNWKTITLSMEEAAEKSFKHYATHNSIKQLYFFFFWMLQKKKKKAWTRGSNCGTAPFLDRAVTF